MKVSELTVANLAAYLKIESDDMDVTETAVLTAFLDSARHYAVEYTGRTVDELDGYSDAAIAVLCLAGDFYTNRDMYTNLKGTGTASVNQTVSSILNMYAVNLVPTEEEPDVSA